MRRSRFVIFALALAFLAPAVASALGTLPPSTGTAYGPWAFEQVDSTHSTSSISIAMDPQDVPHAAIWIADGFGSGTRYEIDYASPDGLGGWTEQLAVQRAARPALVIDHGVTGMAYEKIDANFDGWLGYSHLVQGVWVNDSPTPSIRTLGDVSLAIDAQGYPHIAWREATLEDRYAGGPLYYAFEDAQGWHTEVVDHHTGISPQVRIDHLGIVHITYQADTKVNGIDTYLAYATRLSNGTWSLEYRPYKAFFWESLAFDQENQPHIAYRGGDLKLHHSWKDASGWQDEVAETGRNAGITPSIAIGSDDRVQIVSEWGAGQGVAGGHIHYVVKNADGSWAVDEVDSLGWTRTPTLVLDSGNVPHVVYWHLGDATVPERGGRQAEYAVPASALPMDHSLH